MQVCAEGLRALEPDIVALQEVRQVEGLVPNQAETLASALGHNFCFAVSTPWGGGEEGLAILSRWPLLSYAAHELPHATEAERRILLGAEVETPSGVLQV